MIWKASGGVSEEVNALVLLPFLLGVKVDACPAASTSISIVAYFLLKFFKSQEWVFSFELIST